MSKFYDGIEHDAFALASVYFGTLDLLEKGASSDELLKFLDNSDEGLRDVACRVMNGGDGEPSLIDASPLLRLVK